jgi:hypothetical protein
MIGKLYPLEGRHLCSLHLLNKQKKADMDRCNFTNEKNQTLCRGFNALWPFHLKLSHSRDNGTDEIDIEYGEDVDQMESECNG